MEESLDFFFRRQRQENAVQPGDVPVTFASLEKAERLLGFRPRVTLREGLRRSVEWYRSQPA